MNPLNILKKLAIAEGISYLCFAVTMPLKYGFNLPGPNLYVGMIHGILFIAYCLWVLIVGYQSQKKATFYLVGWLMSLIPLGTFWFDRKYLS
ncbi:MAG: DUF3817 domain-containing protein [Flavobacteriales bacterium]